MPQTYKSLSQKNAYFSKQLHWSEVSSNEKNNATYNDTFPSSAGPYMI